MSGNGHCFVEWKEEFVSQERGNRVVHYFLKGSSGESIRAVIGTERSVRHMFYIVAEEFVEVYGADHSIHAGFKWRSRREVVDWLTSMLSKQHLEGDRSKSPKHDALLALRSLDCAMIDISAQKALAQNDLGHFSRNLIGQSSDIVWSGSAWTCGENHYLAYLEDMYEDKRGQKKVKVRWFHHTKEVKGVIPVRNPHPKEVFITTYSQVISAECVDGLASVLTREHYEKCAAVFPDALLARAHVCSRHLSSEPESTSHGLNEEEDEQSAGVNVKLGNKRSRTNRSSERFVTEHSGNRTSSNHLVTYDTSCKKIKYALSGKKLLSLKHAGSLYRHGSLFKMKVQYDDVQDEDGYGNLEEWIPICKLAMPDKLGTSIGDVSVQVYFPGENLFVNIHKTDLRISRDWDGDRWIDIEARPDILSLISDAISPDMDMKVSMSTTPVMDAKLDGGTIPVEAVPAKTIAEGEKPELAFQDSSDNLEEETGGKELASLKDEKDEDASDSKKPLPSENGKRLMPIIN
ncbi:Pectin lyase-like superfamily protein [Hibiscus syriacus]|uniref:Pectin lyase-like superfamily protein n=1 Tax=Hibiscus syriacus TaxID=106335 RepID=A0A6A2YLR2_HIBSY|nr:Pectin lyase-like superfamily protein [Hibiscus syriacus]